MIKGMHGMFYSSKAEELRAFLRDKLGMPHTDIGQGWLIFNLSECDLGCHPVNVAESKASGKHDISFYCDDLEETVAELRSRGVEFLDEITDQGYGFTIHLEMPGGVRVQIYQPKYEKAPVTGR